MKKANLLVEIEGEALRGCVPNALQLRLRKGGATKSEARRE